MSKVILINPSVLTAGFSFFTPRWLYVMAQATPSDLVGDPIIVDETIRPFDPDIVQANDIVGIGINTGNCCSGYKILKSAKARGATVVMGGVHTTIFPDEPLEMGADAVVTGNGDLVWSDVVRDTLAGRLKRRYDGGRVPGSAMLKARWDLLDPQRYLFPTVQTVAGCPENCSFCSVWVTDGRTPRQRLSDKIIEEVNELYGMGFRYVTFADDNFSPATIDRITRERDSAKRKVLEKIREDRLQFFEEYATSVPRDMFGLTQMTAEVANDPEYFSAMHQKMRIRAALIGVESFTEEGLASANKNWNPLGNRMVETVRNIQEGGILVLASIICGLESDTKAGMQVTRRLAIESGALLAQFTLYCPYPGTKDFHEMRSDNQNTAATHNRKRQTQLLYDRFWLDPKKPAMVTRHPQLSNADIIAENVRCWNAFYSLREIIRRVRTGAARTWTMGGKLTYLFACLAFKGVYAQHGLSADDVRRKRLGIVTRAVIRFGIAVYCEFFRRRRLPLKVMLAGVATDRMNGAIR